MTTKPHSINLMVEKDGSISLEIKEWDGTGWRDLLKNVHLGSETVRDLRDALDRAIEKSPERMDA